MFKKQESGRSMIEMLGVLAIIGVLSVGGIAGYTTAMRSYKANEIVNATSMLYMMGVASNGGEGTATLTYTGSFGNQLSDLKEITYTNGTLAVQITDDAVCNQVMTKLGSKATGNCTTATDGAYTLTVTLGEVVAMANPDGKSCNTDRDCVGDGSLGDAWECCSGATVNNTECAEYGYGENKCFCNLMICPEGSAHPGHCTGDSDYCCGTCPSGKHCGDGICEDDDE